MMLTEENPANVDTANNDVNHFYCEVHNPLNALCGTPLTFEEDDCEEGEVDCVVCLEVYYCPLCEGCTC